MEYVIIRTWTLGATIHELRFCSEKKENKKRTPSGKEKELVARLRASSPLQFVTPGPALVQPRSDATTPPRSELGAATPGLQLCKCSSSSTFSTSDSQMQQMAEVTWSGQQQHVAEAAPCSPLHATDSMAHSIEDYQFSTVYDFVILAV